jgi:hypothetical protein
LAYPELETAVTWPQTLVLNPQLADTSPVLTVAELCELLPEVTEPRDFNCLCVSVFGGSTLGRSYAATEKSIHAIKLRVGMANILTNLMRRC